MLTSSLPPPLPWIPRSSPASGAQSLGFHLVHQYAGILDFMQHMPMQDFPDQVRSIAPSALGLHAKPHVRFGRDLSAEVFEVSTQSSTCSLTASGSFASSSSSKSCAVT